MKVCAHINYEAFNNGHERFDSVSSAVEYFRDMMQDKEASPQEIEDGVYCMDLFPQCDRCSSNMCFHDYPMARYQLGRRGGVSKVLV